MRFPGMLPSSTLWPPLIVPSPCLHLHSPTRPTQRRSLWPMVNTVSASGVPYSCAFGTTVKTWRTPQDVRSGRGAPGAEAVLCMPKGARNGAAWVRTARWHVQDPITATVLQRPQRPRRCPTTSFCDGETVVLLLQVLQLLHTCCTPAPPETESCGWALLGPTQWCLFGTACKCWNSLVCL